MKIDIKAKNGIRKHYGINRFISGDYDKSASAKCFNGIFAGKRKGPLIEYRGIPFAMPPTGDLRWKKPEPVRRDGGVFEAFYNGKTPIQTEWFSERASYYPQGEDCLYLNIWTSDLFKTQNKTVMVFFHGGSYGWGGTADPLYDGKKLVTAHPDIVLVTAGYRTGIMGFTDLSEVPGGEDFPDAQNLGILDQIEALRWVHENINAFGGDPDNVTIFGESAGGGSVSILPLIPEAKGLFKRVIAESGSVALTSSKDECRLFTKKLLHESGCNTMDELMALSEKDLMKFNEKINTYNCFPQRDGRLIPVDPYNAYNTGISSDIDMMIGTNANEINYWISEVGGLVPFTLAMPLKFENDIKLLSSDDRKRVLKFVSKPFGHRLRRILEFYNEIYFRLPAIKQVRGHSSNGGKVFNYYWNIPSTFPFRGACHAVELAYVFGNIEDTVYTGKKPDKAVSDMIMQMWTDFARTGNPSNGSVIWKPFTEKDPYTLVIGDVFSLEKNVLRDQEEELSPILDYMINAAYTDPDLKVPFVYVVSLIGITAVSALLGGIAVLLLKRKKKK